MTLATVVAVGAVAVKTAVALAMATVFVLLKYVNFMIFNPGGGYRVWLGVFFQLISFTTVLHLWISRFSSPGAVIELGLGVCF